MTATITDTRGTDDSAADAPRHCGDPMTLRETSYRSTGYGIIDQVHTGFDVELVWACSCGFQLSYAEPADLALPLSSSLRRLAAASADLELYRWKLDQADAELADAVRRAVAAGTPVPVVAEAAHLEPATVRELVSVHLPEGGNSAPLSHVG